MSSFRTLLLDLQNGDGGWGAARGRPSNTETTSLALMALRSDGGPDAAAAVGRALPWLRARQRPDGAWALSAQVPGPSWTTPLAVLALGRFESDRARALQGARWLLEHKGRGYPWLSRLFFRLFPEREVVELDPDLKGWPWMPDTFSWVEPTAYALMALKTLRAELPRDAAHTSIHEGERMILDRMCPGGGWNYGNSRVLDEDLWPYPDTTALALIALKGRPEGAESRASLAALGRMLEHNDSALATSLAILCFHRYGRDVAPLRARLIKSFGGLAALGDTRAAALSVLALHEVGPAFAFAPS
ncbi:MAG TPA: prenyltransferase/squalene oxidase repeat-containing protein [Gemmatimonadota bacterium]|nr:prenyltransferase/squalene oxidase repeat-containing protein [Gemmatimonadota bacterium]